MGPFGDARHTLIVADYPASSRKDIPAARLQPRERKVVLLRFGGELTQDEIARRIGVSQMHVSRILRNATAALAAAPELQ